MVLEIVAIYYWIDEIIKYMGHKQDKRCLMSDSEIITTLIVAARFFSGNIEKARLFLRDHGYIKNMLEKSRFNRRQHALGFDFIQDVMKIAAEFLKKTSFEYVVDSFPVPVCDNVRITRCRIYREEVFRGYTRSKKRYFFGVKVHVITTTQGEPIEFLLTPGSCNDCKALKMFQMDYPSGSIIYADKGYNDYQEEELLMEAAEIELAVQRKIDSKRPHSGCKDYIINLKRKVVETVFSGIANLFPKKIHAVKSVGFEMKIALFLCVATLNSLINQVMN